MYKNGSLLTKKKELKLSLRDSGTRMCVYDCNAFFSHLRRILKIVSKKQN